MADSSVAIIERTDTCMLTYTHLYNIMQEHTHVNTPKHINTQFEEEINLKTLPNSLQAANRSIRGPALFKIQFLCYTVHWGEKIMCLRSTQLAVHSQQAAL